MGEGQISSGMVGTATLIQCLSLCCHNLRFTHEDPGHVYVKNHVSDTEERRVCVLERRVSWHPALPEFPEPLPACGFTEERLKYLQEQVRPFERECYREEFCP